MKQKTQQSLEAQVKRALLRQGVSYLSDALATLHEVAINKQAPESARVQASRALITAMNSASEDMTADTAGAELMALLDKAEHLSDIKTEVPEAYRDALED